MYGFSGYGTNSYGSERQQGSILVEAVKLGARVMQDVYGVSVAFARKAGTLTLTSLYGLANAFTRPNSSRTLEDPSQSNTMQLPK